MSRLKIKSYEYLKVHFYALHKPKSEISKRFISDLSKRDELLTKFDNCLWLTVVDTVTVYKDGILVFKFNDGTEIEG